MHTAVGALSATGIIFVAAISRLTTHSGEAAVGWAFMLVALLAIVWHMRRRLLHVFRAGGGWFGSLQSSVRVVMLGIFITLIAGVVYGQVFIFVVVLTALFNTLLFGTGLLLVHQLLVRWLRVAGE